MLGLLRAASYQGKMYETLGRVTYGKLVRQVNDENFKTQNASLSPLHVNRDLRGRAFKSRPMSITKTISFHFLNTRLGASVAVVTRRTCTTDESSTLVPCP